MMSPRKAANRTAILDSALALFAERGYEAVRVEDITRHAGVSRATFYNHFSDREDILAALFERLLSANGDPAATEEWATGAAGAPGAAGAAGAASAAQAEDLPPLDRVAVVASAAARRMVTQPQLARFLYRLPVRQETLLKPDDPATPTVFLQIHRLLEAAAARGELRTDLPLDLMCVHVHGALEQGMRAWAEGSTDDPAERVGALVELALHGVTTPRS